MTKIYVLTFLFSYSSFFWGQIDVDELLAELHQDYDITGTKGLSIGEIYFF